jgi:hypothetical protein
MHADGHSYHTKTKRVMDLQPITTYYRVGAPQLKI